MRLIARLGWTFVYICWPIRLAKALPVPVCAVYRCRMGTEHRITKLYIRPTEGAVPVACDRLELHAGAGIENDHTYGGKRHVTLVFEEDWEAAAQVAGAPGLDPIGRRANVILSGAQGSRFVGSHIRLGAALLEIRGITHPCPVMDQAHPGMKEALAPEGRAGVWGVVLAGASITIGDPLGIDAHAQRPDELVSEPRRPAQ